MFPLPRIAGLLLIAAFSQAALAQEFRAMWVDAFHPGLRNSTETAAVIAAARAANCNAVVVQVRKRGDAYYRNGLEPVATDVASGFDPLGDLIQRGNTGTPKVEVHAWLVTYNIWNNQSTPPTQASHPYNLHPDWLTQNQAGTKWDGGNYKFDPGHPAVQQHTFDVAMDILSRYGVAGIHLDYVRYSEYGSSNNNQPWGYNLVAVARYKKQRNKTATPEPTDAEWLQWRRDQVTALVRKLYLNARAVKPDARISAALIPWGSAPGTTLASWQSTAAYARVLQDWRGWMEEGILDLGMPMIYRTDNSGFTGWANFTKDRQYNRAAALGMGWYLNTVENTIAQIKLGRNASSGGKTAVGFVGYSYATTNRYNGTYNVVPPATMRRALVDDATAETYDPGGDPVFPTPVAVPPMPWKTNTAIGHLMGYLRDKHTNAIFDGATVTVTGPVSRTLTSDGTGFFGAVDLPVGSYTLRVSIPGYRNLVKTVAISGATVTQPSMQLETVPLQITSVVRSSDGSTLTITWSTTPGRKYRVQGTSDVRQPWVDVLTNLTASGEAMTYVWQVPLEWRAGALVRVIAEP